MRFGLALAALLIASPALAVECAEGMAECKVLILSGDQIKTLKALVDATGISAPYNQVQATVKFYDDLIDKAPAGTVKEKKDKKE